MLKLSILNRIQNQLYSGIIIFVDSSVVLASPRISRIVPIFTMNMKLFTNDFAENFSYKARVSK